MWLIPVTTVRLLLAIVCSLLSGATILITLYPAVKNDSKQVRYNMSYYLLIIFMCLSQYEVCI